MRCSPLLDKKAPETLTPFTRFREYLIQRKLCCYIMNGDDQRAVKYHFR